MTMTWISCEKGNWLLAEEEIPLIQAKIVYAKFILLVLWQV